MDSEKLDTVLEPGAADPAAETGIPPQTDSPEAGPSEGVANADALSPTERQELDNLRKVIGQQGSELGELRPLRERVAQLEAQTRQQPQPTEEPPSDPYQEIDGLWFQQRVDALSAEIEDRLVLRGEDEDDARTQADERARRLAYGEYQVRVKEREFVQKREQERQESERRRRDMTAGADAFTPLVERHLAVAGIPGVTRDEVAQAIRAKGIALSQFEGLDEQTQAGVVATLGFEILGRKAARAPQASASPPQRAQPQQPVPTGPGAAPTGASPDRDVLQTADRFLSQGYFSDVQDATKARELAIDAAREALGR